MFKALATERVAERLARTAGLRRLDEDKGGGAEQLIFECGFRGGPLCARRTSFK